VADRLSRPREYRYADPAKLAIRRPRAPERRLVEALVECYLEAGMVAADAVRSAVELYRELDLQGREVDPTDPTAAGELLSLSELKLIRRFALACAQAGCAPRTAAMRAKEAWSLLAKGRVELHGQQADEDARNRRRAANRKRRKLVPGIIK
jgi:hypothetical protein